MKTAKSCQMDFMILADQISVQTVLNTSSSFLLWFSQIPTCSFWLLVPNCQRKQTHCLPKLLLPSPFSHPHAHHCERESACNQHFPGGCLFVEFEASCHDFTTRWQTFLFLSSSLIVLFQAKQTKSTCFSMMFLSLWTDRALRCPVWNCGTHVSGYFVLNGQNVHWILSPGNLQNIFSPQMTIQGCYCSVATRKKVNWWIWWKGTRLLRK